MFGTSQSNDEDPYVMSLILRVGAGEPSHEGAVLAAATAVAKLLTTLNLPESASEAISQWNLGRVRKIARRAQNKRWAAATGTLGAQATVGEAVVKALVPHKVSQAPPAVKRLQISGLDLPSSPSFYGESDVAPTLLLALNPQVQMSTGKAMAQAGHIAHMAAIQADDDTVQQWSKAGCPIMLSEWKSSALYEVHDAGLTEVSAGTLTAQGEWSDSISL